MNKNWRWLLLACVAFGVCVSGFVTIVFGTVIAAWVASAVGCTGLIYCTARVLLAQMTLPKDGTETAHAPGA